MNLSDFKNTPTQNLPPHKIKHLTYTIHTQKLTKTTDIARRGSSVKTHTLKNAQKVSNNPNKYVRTKYVTVSHDTSYTTYSAKVISHKNFAGNPRGKRQRTHTSSKIASNQSGNGMVFLLFFFAFFCGSAVRDVTSGSRSMIIWHSDKFRGCETRRAFGFGRRRTRTEAGARARSRHPPPTAHKQPLSPLFAITFSLGGVRVNGRGDAEGGGKQFRYFFAATLAHSPPINIRSMDS